MGTPGEELGPTRGGAWAEGFWLSLGELRGLRRGPPGLGPPVLVLLPRGGGPCPPPLLLPRGGLRKLRRLLGARLRACPRDPRLLLVVTPEDPPEPPPEPGLVTRLLQAPGLGGLSLGGLGRLLGGPRGAEGAEPEPPFELLSCVTLAPRPCPVRGPPLARADWGRGLSPEELRERIFRGGVSPELRAQAWPFLLGLTPKGTPGTPKGTPGTPKGTPGTPEGSEGTPDPARARRDDYFRMKLQWRSLSPGQLRRNKILRGYQERMERDLARAPPWVSRSLLREVLLTHCMFHFDLGYVGGMSEVLAPLAGVVPDEAEAFWAFCSIMETLGENFGPGRAGLRRKLGELGALVRVLNPGLSRLLGRGWPRRCCSRWLQLRVQPQLGLEGTRRLWEVLWTGLPCPNFHLLVTCALLELLGDTLGDRDTPGDTPWGHPWGTPLGTVTPLGTPSGTATVTATPPRGTRTAEDGDGDKVSPLVSLEVGQVLSRAEGIFLQLAATKDLPPALQELLGLGGPHPPLEPPPETTEK
ncbi:TBC1 domain family member 17-like isoform X1 [Agelaius tricolor]|uniref:TBC1 domain family member 17-like isoform X1 n=1 Tax=Agelaius tricolor TaxID=9191 RepID=UPI0039F1C430